MKKIVYVRSTGIYNDSRATKEIIALAKAGYRVCVIGWDRNGSAVEECRKAFVRYKNIEFFFFKKKIKSGKGLGNLKEFYTWIRYVIRIIMKSKGLSAIHACDLDSGIGAYYCSVVLGKPLIYDIYDYYIDAHSLPKIVSFLFERMEIAIINHAKCTVICTEERKAQINKAKPRNLIVIHNSPNISEIGENCNASYDYDYVYCGAFRDHRLIDEILNDYEKNNDIKFVFAGSGLLEEKVRQCAHENNFTYLGSIPYDNVIDVEKHSRVISAIYDPKLRNHKLCAPNKFYEALALGKPLIVCRGTGIDKIVDKYGIGIVINYDVNEFYTALRQLLTNKDIDQKMIVCRNLFETKFSWNIMNNRLIRMYKRFV